jgi:UDP-glucuronate 4-epimerase
MISNFIHRRANMKILITGAAGFIGYHLALRLAARGDEVLGLDNLNDYYDPRLKYARLAAAGVEDYRVAYGALVESRRHPNYRFIQLNLEDQPALFELFGRERFDAVVNLAAQAGVRYSLTNPQAYIDSNIVGFTNILESCRHHQVGHLVYASSSSVYGLNANMPFRVADNVDHPISLYAATKKSNELMAHTYSHLFALPSTGLRFFTVYGPWGRPDMALFLFTRAILEGRPIQVFNHGRMRRDFTFVDDIVEGITRVIDRPPQGDPHWKPRRPSPASSSAPYRVYNIGSGRPIALLDFIAALEKALGRPAIKEFLPLQPGDVEATFADVSDLSAEFDYRPDTPLDKGIAAFVEWFRVYYGVKAGV